MTTRGLGVLPSQRALYLVKRAGWMDAQGSLSPRPLPLVERNLDAGGELR